MRILLLTIYLSQFFAALKFAWEKFNLSTSLNARLDNLSIATNPSGAVTLNPSSVLRNSPIDLTSSILRTRIIFTSRKAAWIANMRSNALELLAARHHFFLCLSFLFYLFRSEFIDVGIELSHPLNQRMLRMVYRKTLTNEGVVKSFNTKLHVGIGEELVQDIHRLSIHHHPDLPCFSACIPSA